MKLEKFVWNNGTKDKPIVLTDDEINTLLELKKQDNIEFDVSGYITTSTNKIQKYLKYEIEQAYPNLTITAKVINDNITIGLRSTNINEGESIICYNTAIGLELKYIRCKFTHKINITHGTIDEQSIIDSVSYNHNNYTISTQIPRFNASWTDEVTAKFYPFYEDSSTTNAVTLKFTIKAVAIENIQFELKDTYYLDSKKIKFKYTYTPTNNTKADYITKEVFVNNNKVSNLFEYPITQKGNLTIHANIYLFNKKELDIEKIVSVVERKIDSYYFDNTNISNMPNTRMIQFKITDKENLVLDDILKGITFWRGGWNKVDKKFKVKQVSTKDKSKYVDGSEITDYDDNENTFTFVKYSEFAYRLEYDEDSTPNPFGVKNIIIYFTANIEDLDSSKWKIIPNNYFITVHGVAIEKDKNVFKSTWKKNFSWCPSNTNDNYNNYVVPALNKLQTRYNVFNIKDMFIFNMLYICYYCYTIKQRTNNSIIDTSKPAGSYNDLNIWGYMDEYGNQNIETKIEYNNMNYNYDNFFGIEGFRCNSTTIFNQISTTKNYNSTVKYTFNIDNKQYSLLVTDSSVLAFKIVDNFFFPDTYKGHYIDDEGNHIDDINVWQKYFNYRDRAGYWAFMRNRRSDNQINMFAFHNEANQWQMNQYVGFNNEWWSCCTKLTYTGDYEIIE